MQPPHRNALFCLTNRGVCSLVVVGLLATAVACSDDDSSTPNNNGGSSGEAGTAGASAAGTSAGGSTSGSSGSSGDAGTSGGGAAGTAGSGISGSSGSSASGGSSGVGGVGGTGGVAGTAGTGGSAGVAGSGATSGTAGSAGTGAVAGSGGVGGSGATAGTAGTSGTAGTGGTGAVGGAGGSGGAACPGPNDLPILMSPPTSILDTGLYLDSSLTMNPEIMQYSPRYPLWSDNAEKYRFAYIPGCATIGTEDIDHWDFPVGSRFWKEFYINGILIETRFIHRWGPLPSNWFYVAYQWNDQQTDAQAVPSGVVDANGTTHDIPDSDQCYNCHAKLPEKILGFSAIQLTTNGPGETMASLSANGRLSVPNPMGISPPGDPIAQAALGYLHSNCGNCHNSTGLPAMRLRLLSSHTTVETTDTWTSTVNVAGAWSAPGITHRITPGDPTSSALPYRMGQRGNPDQMPQIGTEVVDTVGIGIVNDWILSLPANP